jgi:hypothetical protein
LGDAKSDQGKTSQSNYNYYHKKWAHFSKPLEFLVERLFRHSLAAVKEPYKGAKY